MKISMSTLWALYRHMLWIAPPVMCLSALLAGISIRNVIRLVKESRLVDLPLVEEQAFEFPEAGRVVLAEEGPQLSSRFRGLDYRLSTDGGALVAGRRAWFHAKTTGISWARVEVRVYEIPHPGLYVLRVLGLGAPREGDAKHRLVFTRPHVARSLGYVVSITLLSGIFIASLVFFFLRLTEKGT